MARTQSPTDGTPAPRRRRRWLRRLFKGTLVFVVLLGALYAFRQPLFGRWVADEVGVSLSEALGVPVRVERVLGSWVADARVEQVTVDTDQALGVIAGFDAEALQVHFDLWEVLFGDVVKGIERVSAEDLRLTLDFTRPSVTEQADVALEDIVAAVPHRFPPIDIEAQLTAITGAGVIEVDDVAITSPGDDVLRLDASQVVLPRPAGLAGALHARVRRTDRGLEWQSDSVVAGLTLRQVTAGVDGSLVARGAAAGADFDLRLGKQDAELRTGTMRIEEVPPWVLRLLPAAMFRPRSGTLTLRMKAPTLQPLRVEAELDGESIDFPDEHIRTLLARATIDGDRVTLTDTRIEARDGLLRATDLVFNTERAWTVASLKQVDVSVKNLQSWVELDRPLAIELHADSADASRVNVRALSIQGGGTSLTGSGRIDVPEDLEGFDEAPFEATLKGTLGENDYGPFRLGGSVSFDGRAFGTIVAPRVEGRVWGDNLTLNGHAIQHLDVNGTWLDDDLELKRLALRSDAATVNGSARLRVEPLNVRHSNIEFEIRDLAAVRSWIPDEEFPQLRGWAGGKALLSGTLEEAFGKFELTATNLHVDGVEVGHVEFSGEARAREVIGFVKARGAWGHMEGTGSVWPADGRAQVKSLGGVVEGHETFLRAPLALDYADGLSFEGLDAKALGGNVRGSASLKGEPGYTLEFEQIDLGALDVPDLAAFRGKKLLLDALVRQSGDGLDVQRLQIDGGDALKLSGKGRLPLRATVDGIEALPVPDANFSLQGSTNDLSTWIDDLPVGAATIEASGNAQRIDVKVRGEQLDAFAGLAPLAAVVADAVVEPGGTSFTGRVDGDPRITATFEGTSDTGWAWTLGDPPNLDGLAVDARCKATLLDANAILALLPESAIQARGKMHGDLTATGPIDAIELGGRVTSEDVQVRLYGVANFVDLTKLEARLVDEKLRVSDVAIAYELGSVADTPEPTSRPRVPPEDELDIPEMRYVREALTALKDMTGTLAGDVEIRRNEDDEPRLYGWLRGRDLYMPFPKYRTSARATEVDIEVAGRRASVQPARIEAGEGDAQIEGWIDLPLGSDERALADMPMEATITANAPDIRALGRILPPLDGVAGSAKGRVKLRNSIRNPSLSGELTATAIEMPLAGWELPLRIATLRAEADDNEVRINDAVVTWGKARATVNASLVPPERWLDDWANQPLNARVALEVADLSLLEEVDRDFRRINGRITGTVHARGTLFRPKLDGAIDLDNIRGALPGALPSVDQLSGRISLQDETIQLTNVRGQLGHAPFTITGSARIPESATPSIDLRLQGQNLRLVQTRDMRMRSDMDLRLAGPVGDLRATGTVRIQDFVYVASMDLLGGGPETAGDGIELFSFPWEPFASTKLDVRVQADDSIRIRTNVLRGNLSADVHYVGTGRTPIARGRAYANDFLVKLPFSSLKVDSGEVRFTEESPNNPSVDITARTEMKGYDLTVRALGQLPDVELRTASVPPLPENEAILLLTTGATSEELRREGLARAALTRIGSVFGQSLLSGGRGPADPDELGFFDRFTFRQGRRVSRTGQETLEVEFEMTDRVYLRAEQDRYDDFNAGVVWRWRFR